MRVRNNGAEFQLVEGMDLTQVVGPGMNKPQAWREGPKSAIAEHIPGCGGGGGVTVADWIGGENIGCPLAATGVPPRGNPYGFRVNSR